MNNLIGQVMIHRQSDLLDLLHGKISERKHPGIDVANVAIEEQLLALHNSIFDIVRYMNILRKHAEETNPLQQAENVQAPIFQRPNRRRIENTLGLVVLKGGGTA